jgi:ubiquinone/menaquinone biosynthesis C-methylase UbiE
MQTLDDKIIREKDFHDKWAQSINVDELLVRETFESPTAIENQYALEQLGALKGKRILDLGCGAGESSVYFALSGSEVSACDISEGFLEVTNRLAKKYKVSIKTAMAESLKLPYPDNYFDFVYGNGVLHHVELEPTAKEINRILKKDGKAIFIEPLPYNPVINIYRQMAKEVRTEDEKPIRLKHIRALRPLFSSLHHKEFWFFSLLIFIHFFFVKRWHPSKVRYWKKVIEEGWNYREMFTRLQNIDKFFLKYFPFLRRLCWNTVIVAIK